MPLLKGAYCPSCGNFIKDIKWQSKGCWAVAIINKCKKCKGVISLDKIKIAD